MILFDEYASIAFATEPGMKNPEKPARPLEELERAFDVGPLVRQAVDDFCWQHINVERLHNGETTPEKLAHEDRRLLRDRFADTRNKFRRLFNIGIFSMAVTIRGIEVIINMRVWDGNQYRPASEVLEIVIPPEAPAPEYNGMDLGDENA